MDKKESDIQWYPYTAYYDHRYCLIPNTKFIYILEL